MLELQKKADRAPPSECSVHASLPRTFHAGSREASHLAEDTCPPSLDEALDIGHYGRFLVDRLSGNGAACS
jgi:hypothetical protein